MLLLLIGPPSFPLSDKFNFYYEQTGGQQLWNMYLIERRCEFQEWKPIYCFHLSVSNVEIWWRKKTRPWSRSTTPQKTQGGWFNATLYWAWPEIPPPANVYQSIFGICQAAEERKQQHTCTSSSSSWLRRRGMNALSKKTLMIVDRKSATARIDKWKSRWSNEY